MAAGKHRELCSVPRLREETIEVFNRVAGVEHRVIMPRTDKSLKDRLTARLSVRASVPGLRTVPSNRDLLDIFEGNVVGCPVVELGSAQALMRGERLGALERAAVEQIRRDACGPEGVAKDLTEPRARAGCVRVVVGVGSGVGTATKR